MKTHQLYQLLKREEGFKLDFKLKLSLTLESEKKEFVKDVIAIANTPGGRGYILFGIEDESRRIVGLEDLPSGIEERVQQIIANRSTPPVPVRFELVRIEERCIGVLTIYKSMQVPHQMLQTGAFYVRRGSTTDKASRHEIANMLQQYGMLSFENVPCRGSSLKDLDDQAIQRFCQGLQLNETQHQLILVAMGVLSSDLEREKYYPTYGGLLLLGKRPQHFIPQAVLEVEIGGSSMGIEGNIIEMLKMFRQKLEQVLPPAYPLEGLMEVVTNALIHRSYWNNGQYTQVSIQQAQIVVTNPMSHEIYESKFYRWRVNPWLYSRLLLMHQQNNFHLGIGLERANALFKEKGQLKIVSDRLEGVFEVTLPGTAGYEEEV